MSVDSITTCNRIDAEFDRRFEVSPRRFPPRPGTIWQVVQGVVICTAGLRNNPLSLKSLQN